MENVETDIDLDFLIKRLSKHPLHIELYRKILLICDKANAAGESKTFESLEEDIMGLPEYKTGTQTPLHYIGVLTDSGALLSIPIDSDGNSLPSQDEMQIDDDAYDDLISTWLFNITNLGKQYIESQDPGRRIASLFADKQEYLPVFKALGLFCVNAKSYDEIKEHFTELSSNSSEIAKLIDGFDLSYFLSALEKSGAIFWNEGWEVTPEGGELLGVY